VVMGEGKKRQIREIGSLLGLPVVRIIRVRIGTLRLGTLKPKEWRRLTPAEVEALRTGNEAQRLTYPPRTGRPPAGKPPRTKRGG